ncbi:MAG: TonB-dependent receptor [Acidobacteria bacterium]|nr:TonB-dependent receptor [Acidobacteriota bacterium]NIM63259.1 TonB-dependent receptor [Acidobacteriota bacterium]NIO60052.1 TonB-dependent receptor [Acidobacteriota bacterium]NIQ31123.1 TonB-dependent receptor [Acidobacteriota bacterium]NIQ86232.1 TonB-dependent receptor [Acidobacteriota bacterium]
MKWIRFALAIGVVGLAFTAASAQSGGLTIVVSDEVGPLPGAIVTISHETGYVKTTSVQTNVQGEAMFPVLRPGRGYLVEVSMSNYGTQRVSDIQVKINDNQRIPVVLAQEMVETVKVVADGQVVKLEDTQKSTKFSEEFVQDLPVPGRFYQNVLTLAPGVQDADGDGNPNVHGSRERDFKATVSGVSNVDPLTGQQMSQVNPNSIEEMEVITAGAGAEFSRAQGGFANIIQKQGSNEFEGVFEFYYRSHLLDGTGAFDASPNLPKVDFQSLQPSFQLSGPIFKDRLWYRLSHEFIDTELPVPTSGGLVVQTVRQGIHSDQLTWQVSPRNKLAYQYQSDPLEVNGFGVSSLTSFESAQFRDRTSKTQTLSWTAPMSPKILVESLVSWQDLNTIIKPTTEGISNSCALGEPFLESAQCFDVDIGLVTGSYWQTNDDNRQRLTVSSKATLYGGRFWGMSHQFKIGLVAENERYFRALERRPNLTRFLIDLSDQQDQGTDEGATRLAIIFANVAVPRTEDVRATGTNWGLFLEDQVRIRQNLSMTLGLRFDREEINSNGNTPLDPESQFAAFLERVSRLSPSIDAATTLTQFFTGYENVTDFVDQLATDLGENPDNIVLSHAANQSQFWSLARRQENISIVNNNLAPRFSLSWDPWSNNKTRFAVTAGRYYDKLFLNIPLIELEPANANLIYNSEPDAGGVQGAFRVTGLRSSVNPTVNISSVTRDLRTPYQDEWTLGFEREIFAETSISVDYINRRFRDQLQDYDLNHAPGDFGRCVAATPTNPATIAPVMPTDPDFNPEFGNGDGILDDCGGRIIPRAPEEEVDPTSVFLDKGKRLEEPDGKTDLYLQNPGWGDIFLVGNFNRIDYDGVVVALTRRQYRSWEMQASYTWSKAKGDGEDFQQQLGDDRSILQDEKGYQSYDQRHVVKVNATTITPWGFRLGTSISWQSGLPYSLAARELSFDQVHPRLDNAGPNSGRVRQVYLTSQRNDQRNDSYYNVDAKFTKEMNLGRGLNMQVSAEVFNLFNDGTLLIYNPLNQTGQQINGNNVDIRRFGRSWQLGFKLAF